MMAVQELDESTVLIQQKKKPQYLVEKRLEKRLEKRMGKSSHPKKYLENALGRRNGCKNRLEKRWESTEKLFFESYFGLALHCSSTGEFWWRNGGRNGLKSKGFFFEKMS